MVKKKIVMLALTAVLLFPENGHLIDGTFFRV